MAKLSQQAQRFIVVSLARYDSPSEVAEAVREYFQLDVTLPQLGHYDPTTRHGRQLGRRWKDLFHEERGRVNQELDDIPLAHRAVRMRQLQKVYDRAAAGRNPNPKLLLELIVEAEKIMGDVYTGRLKLEHSGRVEGTGVLVVPTSVTTEEWMGAARDQQAALLRWREVERDRWQPPPPVDATPPDTPPPSSNGSRRFTLN